MKKLIFVTAASVLLLGACGGKTEENKPQLTEREKDSVLAGSRIPGAKAVGRAMTSADSAAARQARLDSAQNVP
jgi:protein involved in sex pheromone biosynthesis